jgi:murein DD-endopeptidase MepM/ murein hydrolase activator NlpD
MSLPSSITPPIDLTRAFSLETSKDQPVDRAKLATMAQEFEAMLLLQMVKQMRQSLLPEEEEEETGFGNDTMTETVDMELARYLAKSGGIGLQKVIEQAVGKTTETVEGATASPESGSPESGETQTVPSMMPLKSVAPSIALPEADPSALAMPLDADTTSKFGWRGDPFHGRRKFHNGVDLRAAYGTEVPAAGSGTVTFAGEKGGYGLMVAVQHDNGIETRYAHLASAEVHVGDRIEAGQALGRVGSSGRSTGPHLHFEVLQNGQRVDPEQIAPRRTDVDSLTTPTAGVGVSTGVVVEPSTPAVTVDAGTE